MTPDRRILSVIGAHSGCGKTTFVVQLLRRIGGLGTLKISPAYDEPEGGGAGGDRIGGDFYLEDPTRLHRPGKDTALYLEAGALHVERLRHRGDGLAAGLDAALARFPPGIPVIVESSSAVKLLAPVAVVLVVRPPPREIKPSTRDVLARVTDLLVNASDRDGFASTEAEHLCAACLLLRPRHTWCVDLVSERLPAALLTRLRGLLTAEKREKRGYH